MALSTSDDPADTIFALASAHGRAGVAVMRISGPRAGAALQALGVDPLPAPRVATLCSFRWPETPSPHRGREAAGYEIDNALSDGRTARLGSSQECPPPNTRSVDSFTVSYFSSPTGGGIIDRTIIDKGLALYFPAPHSFTGEDVVELHLHGSKAVVEEMLAALGGIEGLRLAEPGEFSRRAYLSGKFDLTAAEGLGDLINAETQAQKAQALRLMEGHAGKAYDRMRKRIVKALALLEAYLDFPDEEIPDATLAQVDAEIAALRSEISALLDDDRRGEKTRDGLVAVILGAPNAGKSSLLNHLAKRDVAIVSDIPGTTRDMIEVELNLGGYKLTLVDTAGLRESKDSVESEGVTRARKRAATADLKLALFDAAALPHLDPETLSLVDANTIAIASRWDLAKVAPENSLSLWEREANEVSRVRAKIAVKNSSPYTHLLPEGDGATCNSQLATTLLPLSTATGDGCAELIDLLKAKVSAYFAGEPPLVTHARHRAALERALAHLAHARPDAAGAPPVLSSLPAIIPSEPPLELLCEDLRRAALELGKITGKIAVDEVLDVLFREFCIGK